jgi:hypothetical protein
MTQISLPQAYAEILGQDVKMRALDNSDLKMISLNYHKI